MARENPAIGWPGNKRNKGFTLVEVLTALVVMGVATSIFFSLFFASLALGESSRWQRVAAGLAEERLAHLQNNPGSYEWPDFSDHEPGELLPVTLPDPDGAVLNRATPPATMPTGDPDGAYTREANFYAGFEWQIEARLPAGAPTQNHVEVVVKILRISNGSGEERKGRKARVFALTSCMARPTGAPTGVPAGAGGIS